MAIQIVQQPIQTLHPRSLDDISLKAGQRGIILGMTRTGKSTLAEQLIVQWMEEYPKARTVILDTKPRFKAEKELDGRSTRISRRYANWDWGETIPGSCVVPLTGNPHSELRQAWTLGYRCVIAQINKRSDIRKCDAVLQAAYEDRKRGHPLFFYVDELNNFFRSGHAVGNGIVMAITSGGERSTAFLGAAQRPRWISVEAMESMTNLYWFYTPFKEDVKHLKNMGVPNSAHPATQYYTFYYFNRLTRMEGVCSVKVPSKKKGA